MTITAKAITVARKAIDKGEVSNVVIKDATPGLSLAIGRRGSVWKLDYQLPLPGGGWSSGKRMTLGNLEDMDLDAARAAARLARADIKAGLDPAQLKNVKRAAVAVAITGGTVAEAVARFTEERQADWTKATRAAFAGDLAILASALGPLPVASVTRPDLELLIKNHLAASKAKGAVGVRRAERIAQLIAAIWKQAGQGGKVHAGWKWPSVDPAVAADLTVAGLHRLTPRKRVLSHGEIRTAWAGLQAPGQGVGMLPRLVMALSLVTGLRLGALAGLRVDDLNLDPAQVGGLADNGPTMTIRATDGAKFTAKERRSGVELVLPLSPLAVGLFRQALEVGGGQNGWVFPGNARNHVAVGTISRAWGELGLVPGTTTHDLRRSARTGMDDLDEASHELAEALIGHKIGSTTARTYSHGKKLARLRPLADAWGRRLMSIVGHEATVISLPATVAS
jgi:integrase